MFEYQKYDRDCRGDVSKAVRQATQLIDAVTMHVGATPSAASCSSSAALPYWTSSGEHAARVTAKAVQASARAAEAEKKKRDLVWQVKQQPSEQTAVAVDEVPPHIIAWKQYVEAAPEPQSETGRYHVMMQSLWRQGYNQDYYDPTPMYHGWSASDPAWNLHPNHYQPKPPHVPHVVPARFPKTAAEAPCDLRPVLTKVPSGPPSTVSESSVAASGSGVILSVSASACGMAGSRGEGFAAGNGAAAGALLLRSLKSEPESAQLVGAAESDSPEQCTDGFSHLTQFLHASDDSVASLQPVLLDALPRTLLAANSSEDEVRMPTVAEIEASLASGPTCETPDIGADGERTAVVISGGSADLAAEDLAAAVSGSSSKMKKKGNNKIGMWQTGSSTPSIIVETEASSPTSPATDPALQAYDIPSTPSPLSGSVFAFQ